MSNDTTNPKRIECKCRQCGKSFEICSSSAGVTIGLLSLRRSIGRSIAPGSSARIADRTTVIYGLMSDLLIVLALAFG